MVASVHRKAQTFIVAFIVSLIEKINRMGDLKRIDKMSQSNKLIVGCLFIRLHRFGNSVNPYTI